jgi:hypothetical protein
MVECPDTPQTYGPTNCPITGECTRTLTCASGAHAFTFDCDSTRGYSIDAACDHPYDHCSNPAPPYEKADCVQGRWHLLGVGGNPPAPCPSEPPAVGKACNPSGFGGDREHCGYLCPDGKGWTVLSCVTAGDAGPTGAVPRAWEADGACGDGGTPPE